MKFMEKKIIIMRKKNKKIEEIDIINANDNMN
jgi:hypothetical protein